MDILFFNEDLSRFIDSLEKTTIMKLLRMLDLLEVNGSRLRMPHSKKIRSGLFELRIRGSQEVRLLYTFHDHKIIILHGLIKKTQSLLNLELAIAERRRRLLDGL